MKKVTLDAASLAQHTAAGGKAPVTITHATMPHLLNSTNPVFSDIMELVNNSKAKADKRNADKIELLVRFGQEARADELLLVDDGMGQEGVDQMRSFVLGNGSNQNRAPGDDTPYVYSNKGLGRQAVMARRSDVPVEITKTVTSTAYHLVTVGNPNDGSIAAGRLQVVLPVQLLALDLSVLTDAELAQTCQKAVSTWLTSNPAVLQGTGSSKAAAMSSFNEAATALFKELRPEAPHSLRRMLALCRLIGAHGNLTYLQLRPEHKGCIRLQDGSTILAEFSTKGVTDTERYRPLTELLADVYVHSKIVEELNPGFYTRTKLKDPAPVKVTVGQFSWAITNTAAAPAAAAAAAAAAGGARRRSATAGAAAAAAASKRSGSGTRQSVEVVRSHLQEVKWDASPVPAPLFLGQGPVDVIMNGQPVARAKLFASPAGSGQCLEQHLKPFYSDAHLLAATCQSGYERMAQVINTTRTTNTGKGPSCIQKELKELADKLAQQYHWDRDEMFKLIHDTKTAFCDPGIHRFNGKGLNLNFRYRLQQLAGGYTLYVCLNPQLVLLNQAKDDVAEPGVFWAAVFRAVGGVLVKHLQADLAAEREAKRKRAELAAKWEEKRNQAQAAQAAAAAAAGAGVLGGSAAAAAAAAAAGGGQPAAGGKAAKQGNLTAAAAAAAAAAGAGGRAADTVPTEASAAAAAAAAAGEGRSMAAGKAAARIRPAAAAAAGGAGGKAAGAVPKEAAGAAGVAAAAAAGAPAAKKRKLLRGTPAPGANVAAALAAEPAVGGVEGAACDEGVATPPADMPDAHLQPLLQVTSPAATAAAAAAAAGGAAAVERMRQTHSIPAQRSKAGHTASNAGHKKAKHAQAAAAAAGDDGAPAGQGAAAASAQKQKGALTGNTRHGVPIKQEPAPAAAAGSGGAAGQPDSQHANSSPAKRIKQEPAAAAAAAAGAAPHVDQGISLSPVTPVKQEPAGGATGRSSSSAIWILDDDDSDVDSTGNAAAAAAAGGAAAAAAEAAAGAGAAAAAGGPAPGSGCGSGQDVSEVAGLRATARGLQEQVNGQQMLLAKAEKDIAGLKAQLVAKDARIAELEVLLQQANQQ